MGEWEKDRERADEREVEKVFNSGLPQSFLRKNFVETNSQRAILLLQSNDSPPPPKLRADHQPCS